MENSGFNLMAGVIIAAILVMGVSMSVYNGASSAIVDSTNAMAQQEKDAFNSQFTSYEGSQSGAQIKALCSMLIANSNTYQDEINKIPKLTIADKINDAGDEIEDAEVQSATDIDEYVKNIGKIREAVESKHTYLVAVTFNSDGIINEITIYYEEQ